MKRYWQKAADYAGLEVTEHQRSQMDRFGEWLSSEGVRAGGIGPNEVNRIDQRHLADSVLFATGFEGCEEVWDLGTGVGLPGVPLAILFPQTRFKLIDRSQRRVDLVRRAVRITDLENCQVIRGEIDELSGTSDTIVSRASLPVADLGLTLNRILAPGGVAVAGGSWKVRPEVGGWMTKEIPVSVLDRTVWLLIMRHP